MDTSMSSTPFSSVAGTLYGIGVGPGSPDLLTLRAVEILRRVDVVLAAASPRNDHSLALEIARPHLPENVTVIRQDFPMTRDKAALREAWAENARLAAEILQSGRNAAFLTLGDPLIYSTFGYLMRTLNELHPGLAVEIVPGVTSFQAAAAATRTVLCEGEENLLLVAGINKSESLEQALAAADSAVILKAYRNAGAIYEALAKAGKNGETVFASRLGLAGEVTARGLENAPEKPSYLSLLLVPPVRPQG